MDHEYGRDPGAQTKQVNLFLKAARENLRLQPRKVGAVLTSLGFSSRMRTNSGWVISLGKRDAEKLHQLASSHGIDGVINTSEGIALDKCSLCRVAGLGKKVANLVPAESGNMFEVGVHKAPKTRRHW